MRKALRLFGIAFTLAMSLNTTTALACSRFWINNYLCPGEVIGCTLIGYYDGGGCIYACPAC